LERDGLEMERRDTVVDGEIVDGRCEKTFLCLKVPKRENFSIAFFAQSEPIWICDVGTSKKIKFFTQLAPDFDGFWFFAAY
jgi:hypothetical protein